MVEDNICALIMHTFKRLAVEYGEKLSTLPEGRFSKLGLDLELDDDFQVDVGVELDGLALPGEVKLDFLCRKSSSNRVAH